MEVITLKSSLSIWSLHSMVKRGEMDMVSFIDYAFTTGVEGVELVSFFWKDKEKEIPLIINALKRNNLQLCCYSINNDFAKPSIEEREAMITHVKNEIDTAIRLGTKIVRVFSSDYGNGENYNQAKVWIVEGLKKAAQYAKTKGIIICLENHGYYAGTSDQIIEIFSLVNEENLKLTLDIGNFILVDEDPKEAIEKLKDKAVHVHLKDSHEVGEDYQKKAYTSNSGRRIIAAVLGTGIVDVKHAIRTLKSVNYKGFLSVEYDGNEENTKPSVEEGILNLKKYLKEIL